MSAPTDEHGVIAQPVGGLDGQGTVMCARCRRLVPRRATKKRMRGWYCATSALKRSCKAKSPPTPDT